jgi:hypothetical protein
VNREEDYLPFFFAAFFFAAFFAGFFAFFAADFFAAMVLRALAEVSAMAIMISPDDRLSSIGRAQATKDAINA